MGDTATTSPTIPGASNIVFPYYKNIDTDSARITYTKGITSSSSQMSSVNGFIQIHINNTFSGIGMMVVKWNLISDNYLLDKDGVSITPYVCSQVLHTCNLL